MEKDILLALIRVRDINFFQNTKEKRGKTRQDKTKETNNRKKMRKKRKEINCLVYIWK